MSCDVGPFTVCNISMLYTVSGENVMLPNVCVEAEYSIVDVMIVNVNINSGVVAEDNAFVNYITLKFSPKAHTKVRW